jgi:hypothetical protein
VDGPALPAAESCRVNGSIRLNVRQFHLRLTRLPEDRPLERHLDAADVAVIVVVDQPAVAADRRLRIAHLSQQQAGVLVEVQLDGQAAVTRSLEHLHVVIAERRGNRAVPVLQRLLELRGERERRIELDAFELCPLQAPGSESG